MAQNSIFVGKLQPRLLKQLVFTYLGVSDPRVLLGPGIGEDATVIDFGNKALVVHSDPITGAIENAGWLAVNICANDIATRGVCPKWMLIVLLLPENINFIQLKNLTTQIDEAAKLLDIAVVGGHTEVTQGMKRPIIIATVMGEAKKGRFIKTSGAKVGDSVIVTKGVAIEGTAILSHELYSLLKSKVNEKILQKAKQFIKKISVVKDALAAMEVGGVHAMHDATEGGIAGALQELVWASNVGIVAYEEKILIAPETEILCKTLNIDPLKTISSGALLISAQPEKAEKIVTTLRKKSIQASVIGRIQNKKEGAYIIRKDCTRLDLKKPVKEELWKALEKRL
jgi:hydrogenase maturation factor